MTDEPKTEGPAREWSVEECLEKLRPRRSRTLSAHFKASERRYIEEKDLTPEMLHECYVTMARIVKLHGAQYLPIFERIHAEIENRNARQELLQTALQISKDDRTDILP